MSLIRTAPATGPTQRHDGPEPLAPRQQAPYRCERGHEFMLTLAAEIEPPATWDCRCGAPADHLVDVGAAAAADGSVPAGQSERERRMAQLLQRRSVAELERILAGRLAELGAARQTTNDHQSGRVIT